ncbi:MAG TPA: class I SAM-dependent RNA methyltransferase [Anaeromyxobacter sp.]|nr:class I SAM-dependent RNA methyltransferase [Anaeromyxobacter sp.]
MNVELDIDDLAPGGEGTGRAGERAVFVPWTAPGDRAEVDVPPGDGPARARLGRVVAPGRHRVAPPCRHFGPGAGAECGGCEWQHVAYAAQLAAKERTVGEALRRIGRLDPAACGVAPIVPSPSALRYRSRAKLHLDRASGRLVFFRRRSHDPVPVEACHLLVPALEALRAALGPALGAARLAPREVALEWSDLERRGSALLALEPTVAARSRAEALLASVPALAGVLLRGDGPAVAVGDPVLRHARVPGRPQAGTQRSRPDVFQQANRAANALLVEAALDLLRPDGEDVLELYCGAGNFTGPLAGRARVVAAVEGQGPALELARQDLAAAANVRFFAGDALELAGALAREPRRFGAVLLDPPREGARGIGRMLRALGAPRAVYVSCDPATLARDVRGCVEERYRVSAVRPLDLFPQTHHVEAVVLLEDRARPPG